ncbi:MAG: hypothetical protein SOU05_05810 [Atopobium sp.]|uniref:hypothetical protein n=1 Tax=Atopobium sp. TaxID=1872650 RepID=UPI002A75D2CD|nr:hypothetical protein [Atopobium sp.]MDY2788902.1 hypothetical protein [Atopobium sp.]MDY4522228.1 hypothetical protein [Atopobium sp.]
MSNTDTLTDSERAELEALRAQATARHNAAERAELESLRQAQQKAQRQAEEDARIAHIREVNRRAMEPDEDLNMPFAQKLVLGVLAVVVIGCVIYYFLRH